MDEVVLIIKTHSDYSYLWQLIDDQIKDIKIKKYIFHNKTSNELPKNFEKYLEYNEEKKYLDRLKYLTENIKEKYLLLVHDVDIIINFDLRKLEICLKTMEEKNLDYISLNLTKGNNKYLLRKDDLILSNLKHVEKTHHLIPYDVSPRLWKRESLNKLSTKFKNLSYNESEENNELQQFCRKFFKCYSIDVRSNCKIIYCRNLTYPDFFNFLHITTKGRFTYPVEIYMDNKEEFILIINKYNLDLEKSDESGMLKNRSYLI